MVLNYKIGRFYDFLSLLKVEPFLFLFMFVYHIKRVPLDQLIQDKICRHKYNLSEQYCFDLPEMSKSDDYLHKKSAILSDVTEFNFHGSLIILIISVPATLLIGAWIDRYIPGKKVLMMFGALSALFESSVILLCTFFFDIPVSYLFVTFVPSSLCGGILGSLASGWSYVASTTPPHYRALRMTFVELSLYSASPLGIFLGGTIMTADPWFSGQLRNNASVFIICCVTSFLAFLWSFLMINEERDKREFLRKFPIIHHSSEIEINASDDEELDDRLGKIRNITETPKVNGISNGNHSQTDRKEIDKRLSGFRLLFDFKNVKEIFVTCLKRRENNARLQIWLLFLAASFYILAHSAPAFFLYQFAQKIYLWNGETYSVWSSVNNLCNAAVTLTIIPVFIKVFKYTETTLALIGLYAYFAQNMLRGLILKPIGFYISIGLGALGSVTSVGLRSYLSKIVERTELGKVFSLMSALESLLACLAPAIFSSTFRATIDTMPGMCFVINAGLLIIPIFSVFWIDLYTRLPVILN